MTATVTSIISPADEIEASYQGDAVLLRRHGYVPRLGHTVLALPLGNECADAGGALCSLEDAREVVALRDGQTKWAGEKQMRRRR